MVIILVMGGITNWFFFSDIWSAKICWECVCFAPEIYFKLHSWYISLMFLWKFLRCMIFFVLRAFSLSKANIFGVLQGSPFSIFSNLYYTIKIFYIISNLKYLHLQYIIFISPAVNLVWSKRSLSQSFLHPMNFDLHISCFLFFVLTCDLKIYSILSILYSAEVVTSSTPTVQVLLQHSCWTFP